MKTNHFTTVIFLEDRPGVKAGTEVAMDRSRAAHYLRIGAVKLKESDPIGQPTADTEEKRVVKPSKQKKK